MSGLSISTTGTCCTTWDSTIHMSLSRPEILYGSDVPIFRMHWPPECRFKCSVQRVKEPCGVARYSTNFHRLIIAVLSMVSGCDSISIGPFQNILERLEIVKE